METVKIILGAITLLEIVIFFGLAFYSAYKGVC